MINHVSRETLTSIISIQKFNICFKSKLILKIGNKLIQIFKFVLLNYK